MRRKDTKHTERFQKGLQSDALRLREQAHSMPPGEAREELLRKARQIEIAAHIDDWISSPGLRPPE